MSAGVRSCSAQNCLRINIAVRLLVELITFGRKESNPGNVGMSSFCNSVSVETIISALSSELRASRARSLLPLSPWPFHVSIRKVCGSPLPLPFREEVEEEPAALM